MANVWSHKLGQYIFVLMLFAVALYVVIGMKVSTGTLRGPFVNQVQTPLSVAVIALPAERSEFINQLRAADRDNQLESSEEPITLVDDNAMVILLEGWPEISSFPPGFLPEAVSQLAAGDNSTAFEMRLGSRQNDGSLFMFLVFNLNARPRLLDPIKCFAKVTRVYLTKDLRSAGNREVVETCPLA